MEFCPKCKSLMRYSGKKAICRKCGYEKEAGEEKVVIRSEKNKEEIPVIGGGKNSNLANNKGNMSCLWKH